MNKQKKKPWQEEVGKAIDEAAERTRNWITLEQQITDLWKSRGLEILDIKVDDQGHGSWKWTVLAKEKER